MAGEFTKHEINSTVILNIKFKFDQKLFTFPIMSLYSLIEYQNISIKKFILFYFI